MAKKEVATDVAVLEDKGGALALPTDFLADLASEAKDAAASERPAVSKFSTQGGMLKYGGEPVPGNNLDCVILYASHRNLWFGSAFDRNNIKNPDCFSLSETDEGMMPHENVANPPHTTCSGCPKSEWKSDVKADGSVGKGKACKESRRLVLMPASALTDDNPVDAIKMAELGILDLPVTSAKNYGSLVNTVNAMTGLPVWATLVNVRVQPSKNQFEVVMTPLKQAGGEQIIRALRARVSDAKRLALEPYDETSNSNSAVIQANKAREEAVSKKF